MTVVIPFLGGINPNPNTKFLRAAIRPGHVYLHLVRTYLRLGDIEYLGSVNAELSGTLTPHKLQWQYPHPNEVRAMNTFKTFDQNRSDAQ